LNVSIKVSGEAVILSYEKEHEQHRQVIAGGADGVLVSIDESGRIDVHPPEGPLPTERVREAVRQITAGAHVLGELAHDAGATA
jgi:hypothetical protein